MSSFTRSMRLDGDLAVPLSTLPPKSPNALVNDLLHLFFADEEVRTKVLTRDSRFAGYRGPVIDFSAPYVKEVKKVFAKVKPVDHLLAPKPPEAPPAPKLEKVVDKPVGKPAETVQKPAKKSYDLLDSILPG